MSPRLHNCLDSNPGSLVAAVIFRTTSHGLSAPMGSGYTHLKALLSKMGEWESPASVPPAKNKNCSRRALESA